MAKRELAQILLFGGFGKVLNVLLGPIDKLKHISLCEHCSIRLSKTHLVGGWLDKLEIKTN